MGGRGMKIVFSISDHGAALHVGGVADDKSYIIDIPDDIIPREVLSAISAEAKNSKNGTYNYTTMSVSRLMESVDE